MIFGEETTDLRAASASPLHAAFAEYSQANAWTAINGFAFARRYGEFLSEYDALTNGCAAVDLSVLRRYSLRGPEAAAALARLSSAPTGELRPGESGRGLILDARGGVADLCEVTRLAPELFLLTTTAPGIRRLTLAVRGLDVHTEDIGDNLAALGLFGPGARDAAAAAGFEVDVDGAAAQVRVRGVESFARPTSLGRSIGLELIFPGDEALAIWERLRRTASPLPVGIDACEVARLEGGTPRPAIDFPRADETPGQDGRSPSEIGLPHLAPVDKAWFTGRRALAARPDRFTLIPALIDADEILAGAAVRLVGGRSRSARGDGVVGEVRSARHSPFFRGAIGFVEIDLAAAGEAINPETLRPREGAEIRVDANNGRAALASALETHEWRLAAAYRRRRRDATESARAAV